LALEDKMPKFIVKLSGQIDVEANSLKEAEDKAKKICSCPYVWFNTLEVGKDVDELGWSLKKNIIYRD
jgi:hypothetical protein